MKKLKLNPDELAVESFHADQDDRPALGTVRARGGSFSPEECTWWGSLCTTTAAPDEPCGCLPASDNTCGTDGPCTCPPTPYC